MLRALSKLNLVVTCLLMALWAPTPCSGDWTFVRGDVNDDGTVNVADPVFALAYLFGGGAVSCLDAADTNDDGSVDISDPVYGLSFLFAAGPAPAAPFPDCGEDPTADTLDCVGPLTGCPDGAGPPNIILIIADDFGVDLVDAYGEAPDPPCTPNLDALASQGLLFRNAWAYPVCSPSRAAVLTGKYGFRTGVGGVLVQMQPGLSLSELTVPEMLFGYSTSHLGKWHLAGNQGNLHPNNTGFDDYAGSIRGGVSDYFSWNKVTNGAPSTSTTYATTDVTDDAVSRLLTLAPPFYLQVSFNAPHSPYSVPPASLCPSSCVNPICGSLPPNPSTPEFVKAMTEAMDTELGRFLEQVDLIPNTWIFFMGDNGTARMATQAPFNRMHAKGTVYEGGVNVPLIVRGPGVASGETQGLVSCVDLFATFAELAGAPDTTVDSVSMVPYFSNPQAVVRSTVYSEAFEPNHGTLPFTEHRRAVRDVQYKLIRVTGEPDEFYDLLADPFETNNLLPILTAPQQVAHDALLAEFVTLGVD